jgi:putative Ca2+/H+ antiporter (TMEM165/GDT1 family)
VRELALYVAAGALYVAIGVFVPEVLLAWPVGAAFLLVAVWLLPAAVRRLR